MSLYSPPKFFKIIQNHELHKGELRVPKKFVEKYWKRMPNPVVISLPNGVKKELFWLKREGDIWFQKNWEKFAKFMKFGYVVFFKYIGGACFKLEIFGLNALEIDYSIIKFKRKAEFVEVNGGYTKKQKISRSRFVDETNIASTSQRRKKSTKRGVSVTNPSFKLTLTPTYATGYLFRIPSEFSRVYLKNFEGTASIRRVGEDRIWKLKVMYDPKGYSVVNGGWKPFSTKYNLQTGDVCKFKMIRSKPLSFTVAITRAREEPSI